jgi:hypothetical protein
VPQLTMSSVVREILTDDLTLSADEVIKMAKAKGLKATDESIRYTVHNVRSELKKKAARPAPAADRETTPPKSPTTPDPVVALVPEKAATPAPVPPSPVPAVPTDLTAVLANVALVNAVVGTCGVEPALKTAEAVRACGGWTRSCSTST